MLSFRKDKTGFFSGLALLILVIGTVISTLVLIIVGLAQGNWQEYLLSMKWILGSAWVASITIVLVRVAIFGIQRQKEKAAEAGSEDPHQTEPNSSG